MHSPGALAVAVTMVLLASGLALFAAPPAAATTQPLTPHPSATVSISPTNQFGSHVYSFNVGYANGVVYFSAYDPSDTQATITITDTNATRDNVSNPAFSYVASFSGSSYNDSWTYGVSYLLPLNLTYGGNWTISIAGATGGMANTTFYVHTYRTGISTTHDAYLPGHAGTAVFSVSRDANSAPYTWSTVHVFSQYFTASGTWNPLPGTPKTFSAAAEGSFNFTVPLTASITGQIVFTIFANTSNGNSEANGWAVDVGNMSAPQVSVGSCPSGCPTMSFRNGSTVYVSVVEMIEGFSSSAPAAGIHLTLSFSSGSLPVTPPGIPGNLSTNATGQASFVFLASTSIFSTTQTDEITVTASDPQNPSLPTASTHVLFVVSNLATVAPELQVTFASLQYYSGDNATINWQLGGVNATAGAGWTVNQWSVIDNVGNSLLAWGMINSTNAKGSVSFAIPANYGGSLDAYVTAYNASATITGFTSSAAQVTAPTILLNPSESYYLPGDTVTVSVTTEGSVFAATTLYESVVESSGYQLSAGVLTGNQIQVPIPTTGAPSSITVSVAAQSSSLGIVSTNSIVLDQGSGYVLYTGISTPSNYADGSYQPGQTIHISYSLNVVGTATLPKTFEIYVYPGSAAYFGSGYGTLSMQATSPSGSVAYTIPSSVPAGAQEFTVVVTSGICGLSCGAASQFSAFVEPNPPALDYELGAGSGVTVGWVVLLVLILLVFLAAAVWMRRAGGRSGGKSGTAVKPFEHPSSGASGKPSGDSASGSSAWKEETPASSDTESGSPPMPGSPPH